MINWIKCSEKLPDIGISVLIYVPSYNEIHTAEFCDWKTCDDWHITFGKHLYDPCTFRHEEVSHWQPLPQPPKENE